MMQPYTQEKNSTFHYLCSRIIEKECIPFLGSGISNNCKYDGESEKFSRRHGHTVNGLKKAIRRVDLQWRRKNFGELCELFLWKKYRAKKSDSLKRLVEALQIGEFIYLQPTIAHHCIAMLVREGLIGQIITTNYDCALEKAFAMSHGQDGDTKPCLACKSHVRVVHDQQTCTCQRPGTQSSGDYLHIYKINGCACALEDKNNKDYHDKILLTMTQLQSWRDRRWAKDIFRVALRSNTVLFSGFGSDEPQVIHTVHQILDEYSTFTPGNNSSFNPAKFPFNAPVVQCFEKNPSFCQRQIVNNYICSCNGEYYQEWAQKLIVTRASLTSIDDGEKANLPADDFWLLVFQEVQNRQVLSILDAAARGKFAISALPGARFLFDQIRDDWNNANTGFRARFLERGKKEFWNQTLPTRLSEVLSLLFTRGRKYEPVQLKPNAVCELLLLSWIIGKNMQQDYAKDAQENYWLTLSSKDSDNKIDLKHSLLVASRAVLAENKQSPEFFLTGNSSAVFLLTSDQSSHRQPDYSFRAKIRMDNGTSYRCYYPFSFQDLIHLAKWQMKNFTAESYDNFIRNIAEYPRKNKLLLEPKKKEKYGRRN